METLQTHPESGQMTTNGLYLTSPKKLYKGLSVQAFCDMHSMELSIYECPV